ncbi:MAG: PKD domain-containing protein [Bacteroidales bacterium]|nr:PKD domain-containing protein [Bacteroidales bacterium]
MKKNILLLLVALLFIGAVHAQCHITVTGSFDSECIYDYKDQTPTDEYTDLMVACKNSTVTYTAHLDFVTQSVTYSWAVTGDVSHSATNDQLTVTWDNGEWGLLVVTATLPNGATCTHTVQVKLIDAPTAVAATVPAYTVNAAGDKIIRICKGEPIEFIDHSNAPGADIAGYLWESTGGETTSTPNFTLTNYADGDVVTHRVYNNCGCYDEEEFLIEVMEGSPLELDCYGTVCEGDTVTYHASALSCTEYHWYVDGGTLVGGQGTATPTVQWDRPHNGYGILGLDGTFCDEACPVLMSRKIPVIHSGLTIQGETEVCEGDAVLYSLPLFGSTNYTWKVTPSTGVNTDMMTNTNEARLIFNQAGIYTIEVNYRCEFLDCGPHEAEPLTVTVKPKFAITGDDQLCLGNPCTLSTAPAVTATWHVYALDNGNQPVGSATSGTTYSGTFTPAGRYLVTAEHPDYCGPATFVLTVKDPPAPPTVDDLSPDNLHTACPYSGILLSGTPSNPNYSFVWEPTCSSASPQQYSGDQVNIDYQAQVCDVNIYYYDHQLNCMSATPYVHTVSVLTAAPLSLPTSITVCPNTLITWGDAQVPDQSAAGMLYEWKIQDIRQHCASVQGSHLENKVTLAINGITTPESLYVELTRRWCGDSITTYRVNINVIDTPTVLLEISGADTVCVGSSASYSGSGGNSSDYQWTVNGNYYSGNPITPTFMSEGNKTVLLRCNPYDYCTNAAYTSSATKTVEVLPPPAVQSIVYANGVLSLLPSNLSIHDYSFVWYYTDMAGSAPPMPVGYGKTLESSTMGIYSCTITDLHTGCSRTLEYTIDYDPCGTMTLQYGPYNYCEHKIIATSPYNSHHPVQWHVTGGDYGISYSGYNQQTAEITVSDVGYYTVKARASSQTQPCLKDEFSFLVDFIPNITVTAECSQMTLHNNSKYLNGNINLHIDILSSCGNLPSITFPAFQRETVVAIPPLQQQPCTYTFTLTQVGNTILSTPCTLYVVEAGRYQNDVVSINTENTGSPNNTCNNTPIRLTASLSSNTAITSSLWNFDDGSTYQTNGDNICHTFSSINSYNVTVTVTDTRGCNYTSSTYTITSFNDPYTVITTYLNPTGNSVCPGLTRWVDYYPYLMPTPTYQWCEVGGTLALGNNPQPVQYPDYYYALATNNNFCKKDASGYVGFLNVPTARIRTDQAVCCVGETVTLDGTVHNSVGNVTYTWSVLDPNNTVVPTAATPSISFAASVVGIYTATLTVTDGNSCASAPFIQTIEVKQQSAAPTLAFTGNQCIGEGPVEITATGCTSELHWSNGNTGTTVLYHTPGYATAYCYDPSDGCPSGTGSIKIERQPDFDALLTGCYWKCKTFNPNTLPVYGLTTAEQTVSWEWWRDNLLVTSGFGTYNGVPLTLPLAFGTHHLEVIYQGVNCTIQSPDLTISSKPVCDCEGIAILVTSVTPKVTTDCKLSYTVKVKICNKSGSDFCFDKLTVLSVDANVHATMLNAPWGNLANGDCGYYEIDLAVSSLDPMSVLLQLEDLDCLECTKKFSVSLPIPDCEQTVMDMDFELVDFTSVAVYFDFDMPLPTGGYLYGVYSEPPMITGYNYDVSTGTLYGSGMLDAALLSQLAAAGENICFHAILCVDGVLCKYTFCLSAQDLIDDLDIVIRNSNGSKGSVHARIETDPPALQPNPTTGEVRVTGTKGEVAETAVLDMHGRQMALHRNTDRFNVASLASGTYIVRLKVRDGNSLQTYYLKLVKK